MCKHSGCQHIKNTEVLNILNNSQIPNKLKNIVLRAFIDEKFNKKYTRKNVQRKWNVYAAVDRRGDIRGTMVGSSAIHAWYLIVYQHPWINEMKPINKLTLRQMRQSLAFEDEDLMDQPDKTAEIEADQL